MSEPNNNQRDGLIEFQFAWLKSRLYFLLFMMLAVTPILAISAFLDGNRMVPAFVMILWGAVFAKVSRSFHERGIISYWISLPSAVLILIASFFY